MTGSKLSQAFLSCNGKKEEEKKNDKMENANKYQKSE